MRAMNGAGGLATSSAAAPLRDAVDLGQASLRLFAVIAVVALPGLAALALVLAYAEAWVAEVGFATAFLLIGLATLAWGGMVAA